VLHPLTAARNAAFSLDLGILFGYLSRMLYTLSESAW